MTCVQGSRRWAMAAIVAALLLSAAVSHSEAAQRRGAFSYGRQGGPSKAGGRRRARTVAETSSCLALGEALEGSMVPVLQASVVKNVKGKLGLSMKPVRGWVVITGMDAPHAKLKVGDALVGVDGVRVDAGNMSRTLAAFKDKRRHTLTFTVLRNAAITAHNASDIVVVQLPRPLRRQPLGLGLGELPDQPLRVVEVASGSIAERSGCFRHNDLLLHATINMQPRLPMQPHMGAFRQLMQDAQPGDMLQLVLARSGGSAAGGRPLTPSVDPDCMPCSASTAKDGTAQMVLTLRRRTRQQPLGLQLADVNGSIVIVSLEGSNTPASEAGVQPWDVLRAVGDKESCMRMVNATHLLPDVIAMVREVQTKQLVLCIDRHPSMKERLKAAPSSRAHAQQRQQHQREQQQARQRAQGANVNRYEKFENGAIAFEISVSKGANGFGLALGTRSGGNARGQRVIVREVDTDDPVLRSTVRSGDILMAINRRIVKDYSMDQIAALLRAIPAGSMTRLAMHRNPPKMATTGTGKKNPWSSGAVACDVWEPRKANGTKQTLTCVQASFGYPAPMTKPMSLRLLQPPKDRRSGCKLRAADGISKPFALLLRRGDCFFHEKVLQAQKIGAKAVLIANTDFRPAEVMSVPRKTHAEKAAARITIPVLMVSSWEGEDLSANLTMAKHQTMGLTLQGAKVPIASFESAFELDTGFPGGRLQLGRGVIGRRKSFMRGPDSHLTIPVAMHDIMNGRHTDAKKRRHIVCPTCGGKGGLKPHLHECPVCRAESWVHHAPHARSNREAAGIAPGTITWQHAVGGNFSMQRSKTCHVCRGHGEVVDPGHECNTCGGSGVISNTVHVDYWIPIGMEDGHQIRFPGKAGTTPHSPSAGDLVITLMSDLGPHFKREGADIHTSINITMEEATHGFERNVTLWDGRTLVTVKNSGTTPAGFTKRFAERGLPYPLTEEETKFLFGVHLASDQRICTDGDQEREEALLAQDEDGEFMDDDDEVPQLVYGDLIVAVHVALPQSTTFNSTNFFSSFNAG